MDIDIAEMVAQDMHLEDDQKDMIREMVPIREFKKGTILLKAGQIATESYFNLKGIVRSYYLVNGDEKTTEFFMEGEPVASLYSYNTKTPANHFFECVEDCTLAVVNYDKEQTLNKSIPGFESLCRINIEEEFGKKQSEMANFVMSSPEERYKRLLDTKPELLNRVPQYQLASYLGVKPESLSRIRRRIAQQD